MAQLQHWSVTCTTCDSPAESHCNTCGDILCPRCREIHQRSRATGHHSIVPYSERVEPGKLTEQCDDHPGHQCLMWCQRCDKAACTECVTSADHRGHDFFKMAEKLEEQRKAIREEFDNYSKLLKQWEDSLWQFQSSIKSYESDIDGLGKDITRAADRVCGQVRSIEASLQKQLQDMRNTQTTRLHDHEKVLANGIGRIKQQVRDAEDKLRSDDVGILLHYKARENTDLGDGPPIPVTPSHPTFTPGKVKVQSLEAMLGSLKVKIEDRDSKKREEGTASGTGSRASNKDSTHTSSSTSDASSSKMSLLPTATMITTIQTDRSFSPYLACPGSGQVWVRSGGEKVELMDRHGTVKRTIIIGSSELGHKACTQQGELLISYYSDSSIKSVSESGNISTLFQTEWKPLGLCCLHNGDVVVTFPDDGRVVQYRKTGMVVRELEKSLFTRPVSVAQNKINKHLYVCDKLSIYLEDPGRLLAFDMVSCELKYEYTGSDADRFTPADVCTDQAGHIIITDWNNDRIDILDQDGRFLQYMLTKDQGLYRPFCVDTDTDGYAWIGEWDSRFLRRTSRMKMIKYLG